MQPELREMRQWFVACSTVAFGTRDTQLLISAKMVLSDSLADGARRIRTRAFMATRRFVGTCVAADRKLITQIHVTFL